MSKDAPESAMITIEPKSDDLERYRIRFSLYKVIVGTMIVGLAAVIIPAVIQYWQIRIEHAKQHDEYIRSFVDTAINQDIELRIRLASYFASVAAPEAKQDWREYQKSLVEQAAAAKQAINTKEDEVKRLYYIDPRTLEQQITLDRLERELEWLYGETRYVKRDRSIVKSPLETRENPTPTRPLPPDKPANIPATNASYQVLFVKGDYASRQEVANAECIAYVEHHLNSSASPTANFPVITVASNAQDISKSWASWYGDEVVRRFETAEKQILIGGWNGRGDGNLKRLKIPGIMVDPLLASNPDHASWMRTEEGRLRLASILVDSIRLYFPRGGRVCFSVGHKYKTSAPNDRGAALAGGGTEADVSENILEIAASLLEKRK